jgi:hypothetical protein
MNIDANVATYLSARSPADRYSSFDYCFNYFQSHHEEGRVDALANGPGLQMSCLQLGFYLASWGMLRGSTFLLQRSLRHLAPVIEAISTAPPEIWRTDADAYSKDWVCALLLDVARDLRAAFPEKASDILVTKMMLGVFGCVPAFDSQFKRGSGLSRFSEQSLKRIGRFYEDNRVVIDRHRVPTLDFTSGKPSRRRYSRAKVIDMVFFVEGGRKSVPAGRSRRSMVPKL